MKRIQQGFTLIELMIVVAIVGILAAIALPAYQDYVVRSKMSETEAAIAACKTSVAEYLSSKGTYPGRQHGGRLLDAGSQYVAEGGGWNGARSDRLHVAQHGRAAPNARCRWRPPRRAARSRRGPATFGTCSSKYVPSSFR